MVALTSLTMFSNISMSTSLVFGTKMHSWILDEFQLGDCPQCAYNKVSSMLELTLILPLLDLSNLYENYFRILGQVSSYEGYISDQFDYSWAQVTDCPAKRFVEKELCIIREKRNGNTDFDIPYDEEYQAEYNAYKKLVIEKRKFIYDLLSLTKNHNFYDLFSTDMA